MAKNWLVAIGINGYQNLQPLQYAKQDANSVHELFLNELSASTFYFSDDSPAIQPDYGAAFPSHPTYTTLRRFLRVRFDRSFLKAGDNLWFFFAGHGIRHQQRDYLMLLDSDPGDIENTAIPLNYVTERLRRSGADNIILIVDACRNEGRRGEGIGCETQQGVITFFACSPSESSYEIDEIHQGSFTHVLMRGLRGQEAVNCATVRQLDEYLHQQVPQLNQFYKKPVQTPYTVVEPVTKTDLILLPHQALLADIHRLKMLAQQAEGEGNLQFAKQLWIRTVLIAPDDLDAIEGIERLEGIEPEPLGTVTNSSIAPESRTSRSFLTIVTNEARVNQFGTQHPLRRRQIRVITESLGYGLRLKMVLIPGGTFSMGSPQSEADRSETEDPQHLVKISPFLMSQSPITQAQWKAVAMMPQIYRYLNPEPAYFKGDDRPVEQVSWLDAVEFCERLAKSSGRLYRLPSEAEWEYTCRAGSITPFHFGTTITPALANYDGNFIYGLANSGLYRGETSVVGSFGVTNVFGLFDVHGNVWEWCIDSWHDSYMQAPVDGKAWIDEQERSRVMRGGSWSDDPWNCRSASRSEDDMEFQDHTIGFRVACSLCWSI